MTKEEFIAKLVAGLRANFGNYERSEKSWWLDASDYCEQKWNEVCKAERGKVK